MNWSNRCTVCGKRCKAGRDKCKVHYVPEFKRCPRCEESKPIAAWKRAGKQGIAGYCNPCASAYISRNTRDNNRRIKQFVVNELGGRCKCCGEHRLDFLVLDHVQSDGAADRRANPKMFGTPLLRKLKREGIPPGKFQVLCWNCNATKEYFKGCPHVDEPEAIAWC